MIARNPHLAALSGARAGLACLGLMALLGASGCHKDTPPAETKTTEAKPEAAKTEARRPTRTANPDEGVEVPTEEDFEEAAEKQITSSSDLQKALDQLEKQIQQP